MWIGTVLKWLGIVLGGVTALALLSVAGISVYTGWHLGQRFDVPGTAVTVAADDATIAEGGRLAKLRGCNGGCHGDGSRGQTFFELPGGSRIVAPNIVRAAREYTIEDFERAVRHGVRADGTSVMLAMPSAMFYHLSDDDLGAIVAFLRSGDPGGDALAATHLNVIGRAMMFYYKQFVGTLVAAGMIDHAAPRIDPAGPDEHAQGRYLAQTVCSECHGADLRGTLMPGFTVPTLAVAVAYDLEDFSALMRSGVPPDGRELETMAAVARSRFESFTDDEIEALHAFLQTLASLPP